MGEAVHPTSACGHRESAVGLGDGRAGMEEHGALLAQPPSLVGGHHRLCELPGASKPQGSLANLLLVAQPTDLCFKR